VNHTLVDVIVLDLEGILVLDLVGWVILDYKHPLIADEDNIFEESQ
jgi:hypothetical protein